MTEERTFPDDQELDKLLPAEALEWAHHAARDCRLSFMAHRFAQGVRGLRKQVAEERTKGRREAFEAAKMTRDGGVCKGWIEKSEGKQ